MIVYAKLVELGYEIIAIKTQLDDISIIIVDCHRTFGLRLDN